MPTRRHDAGKRTKIAVKAIGISVPTATPTRPNGRIRSALSSEVDQAGGEIHEREHPMLAGPLEQRGPGGVADAHRDGNRENLDDGTALADAGLLGPPTHGPADARA